MMKIFTFALILIYRNKVQSILQLQYTGLQYIADHFVPAIFLQIVSTYHCADPKVTHNITLSSYKGKHLIMYDTGNCAMSFEKAHQFCKSANAGCQAKLWEPDSRTAFEFGKEAILNQKTALFRVGIGLIYTPESGYMQATNNLTVPWIFHLPSGPQIMFSEDHRSCIAFNYWHTLEAFSCGSKELVKNLYNVQ